MITILFSMTVKAGREGGWRAMLAELHHSTHAQGAGCLAYAYHRRADNPREYVLLEQWADAETLAAHLTRLRRELGALPATFVDLFERTAAVRYEPAS